MALLSLELPPGIYRNGTDLQSTGRYWSAGLVRWFSGELRPMGGWQLHSAGAAAMSGVPRGMQAWNDNSGNPWIAVGTASKLYAMNEAGTLSDITPSGFTAGHTDATILTGYGYGPYGSGAYGQPQPALGTVTPATTWGLWPWGQDLVGCSDADGKIYQWALSSVATVLSNAPTGNSSIVVTPEGFLMALGAAGNPRLLQWSDQEDNNTWTTTTTNQARNFPLQTPGLLMCGAPVVSETLLFTTMDVWAANYINFPLVYGFKQVGNDCGVASKRAVVTNGAEAFWMGSGGFFQYNGSVTPLACDVQDYVFSNINKNQLSKIYAVHNAAFNEVMWLYPQGAEVDSYVIYNYAENHWNIGSISRTCGFEQGVFNFPLMCSATGYIYEHETGFQYDGALPFAETGPFQLGNGDQVMSGRYLYGDERVQGDVNCTAYAKFYPNGPEYTFGPYLLNSTPTDVRFTGRQVRFLFQAVTSDDFRVGNMRVDVVPGGGR